MTDKNAQQALEALQSASLSIRFLLSAVADDLPGGKDLHYRVKVKIGDAIAALESAAPSAAEPVAMKADDVKWIVNNLAELGVMINGQAFFLYKGHSLVYEEEYEDMSYRPVFKREFGECCHPVNYADTTKWGTVSPDDSDEWRPLPAPSAPSATSAEPPVMDERVEREVLRDLLRQAARCMEQAVRIEQVYPDEPPMPADEWSYGADQLVHEIMKALDDCNPDRCRTPSECDAMGCRLSRATLPAVQPEAETSAEKVVDRMARALRDWLEDFKDAKDKAVGHDDMVHGTRLLLEEARARKADAPVAEPVAPEYDVRKILIGIVPGMDGMGHEVYAESVTDVEELLTKLSVQVEDLRATRPPAPEEGKDAAPGKNWMHFLESIVDIYFDGIENDYESRTYVEGSFAEIMKEARAVLKQGAALSQGGGA